MQTRELYLDEVQLDIRNDGEFIHAVQLHPQGQDILPWLNMQTIIRIVATTGLIYRGTGVKQSAKKKLQISFKWA